MIPTTAQQIWQPKALSTEFSVLGTPVLAQPSMLGAWAGEESIEKSWACLHELSSTQISLGPRFSASGYGSVKGHGIERKQYMSRGPGSEIWWPLPCRTLVSHHLSAHLWNEEKALVLAQSKELFWLLSTLSWVAETQTGITFPFALFSDCLPPAIRTPVTCVMPTSALWSQLPTPIQAPQTV